MFVGFQDTNPIETSIVDEIPSNFKYLLQFIYLKSNIDASSKLSKILERNIFTFVPSSRNNKENDGKLGRN